MAILTVEVADELADEFNRLFADADKDAMMTDMLRALLERIAHNPAARRAIADNPELPVDCLFNLLDAAVEGRPSAKAFLPGGGRGAEDQR